MRVLLHGGGGRERALGWKPSQRPLFTELFSAPENSRLTELGPRVEVNPSDSDAVAAFAERQEITLVSTDGRVAKVAGLEDTLKRARETAHEAAAMIDFEGKMRTDIGH